MRTYLITYCLHKPEENYPDFYNAIRRLGNSLHCLESTWIVRTSKNIIQIRNDLDHYIDPDDELLVLGLTGEGAWAGLSAECSSWLKRNL